jgi:hypothetical protein
VEDPFGSISLVDLSLYRIIRTGKNCTPHVK